MGSRICARIHRAGFPLTIYNRTAWKAEPFATDGACIAETPASVGRRCDAVFTSLFDDASVLEICEGSGGLLAGLRPGSVHLGLTTVLPRTAKRLAELHEAVGAAYVSAPVLGRPEAAEAGVLRTFASGNQEAIMRCEEALNVYSQFVLNLGADPATACVMKVCANYIAAAQIELIGEVYAFAEKSSLGLEVVLAAFQTAFADPTLKMYAEKIKNRDFDSAGFDLEGGWKDVTIFYKAFTEVGVSPGIAAVALVKLAAARGYGLGHKDWSATYEITRLMAGLESAAQHKG